MGSLDDLVRDLKGFNDKKTVVRELRKEIRKPLPKVRKAIKKRALDTLPKSGGFNVWMSRVRITSKIKVSGRNAGVKIKGGRNSLGGGRTETNRIDQGRLRAPSWGRRGKGQWHNQDVKAGFFTDPATEIDVWRDACVRAVDNALNTIRGR